MRHLIKLALMLLAAVAATFVYGFVALVAHWGVALLAAGSLVGTYIGLAWAEIPQAQQRRAQHVAIGAMLVEAAYGTLYVMHVQDPALFVPPLPLAINAPLALLHGAAFSVLAYFVSVFVVHERSTAQTPTSVPIVQIDMQPLVQILEDLRADVQALPAPSVQLARVDVLPEPVVVHADVQPSTPVCNCGRALAPSDVQRRYKRCKACRATK